MHIHKNHLLLYYNMGINIQQRRVIIYYTESKPSHLQSSVPRKSSRLKSVHQLLETENKKIYMIKGNKKMRENRGTEIDRVINTEMTREAHRQTQTNTQTHAHTHTPTHIHIHKLTHTHTHTQGERRQ